MNWTIERDINKQSHLLESILFVEERQPTLLHLCRYFVMKVVFEGYKQESIIAFVPLKREGFENIFCINKEFVKATAIEEKVEVPKEAAPEAHSTLYDVIYMNYLLMYYYVLYIYTHTMSYIY